MSRTFLTVIFTWILTRFFYWASGFNPIRDLKSAPGYAADFGIWLAVCLVIYRFLGVLQVGKARRP